MRPTRILLAFLGSVGLAACSDQKITTLSLPPTGAVRFINAVSDTGAVDIRMIDQIEFSAVANGLDFRQGTEQQVTEAKVRKVRVFPTSRDINITQTILLETDLTVEANKRVTFVLVGSARAKTLHFVTINDDAPAPGANNIAVRVVNTAPAPINGYLVTAPTDAIADPAAASNVASLAASAYVTRASGTTAVRVADVGSATPSASAAGPVATVIAGALPAAGVNSPGTAFSVYYFPRGVAGSSQNAVTTPTAVWFADRNPADQ